MNEILEAINDLKKITLIGVKDMLTLEEVAFYTGLSQNYIRQLMKQGDIPYCKPFNGKVYFDKKKIDKILHQGKVTTLENLVKQATTK